MLPFVVHSVGLANPHHPLPNRIVALIPARYGSTRFPGKPLAELAGRPIIEHVYRRTAECRALSAVIVATDDQRVADTVRTFGGDVRLTSAKHASGTDRLAEVAQTLDCALVVNVQGDLPLIEPAMIERALSPFTNRSDVTMTTLRRRLDDPADIDNPHVVKVVVDRHGFALYFSRAAIPHTRDTSGLATTDSNSGLPMYKHIGLYAYRRDFLLTVAHLTPTPLEQIEALEQLRVLEHGFRIMTVETTYDSIEVDTPQDLERVRRMVAAEARA